MKTISTLIATAIFVGFAGCATPVEKDNPIDIQLEITAFQQYMLDEINFARTNPAGYAELRLKKDDDSTTDNGGFSYLKLMIPVEAVYFNNSLNHSSSDYAQFIAENNLTEHSVDETPIRRAIRAGFTGTSTGENIAIASANNFNAMINPRSAAIDFVRMIIIDEGVVGCGHRLILLNSKYQTVGIGFAQTLTIPILNYVVQDFGNL